MGTGIARGFLAAMDTAWMVRSWGMRLEPLDVLAERFEFLICLNALTGALYIYAGNE